MELKINNISKIYGTYKVLDNVTIGLTPGIYGLLGPNGAGKSTLMNIMTDNLIADSGQVLVNGTDIRKLGINYRNILGYAPQQQKLYDSFTVYRFLYYIAALKGMNKASANDEIPQVLKSVNMEEHYNKKLGALSGGMKQRVLIAQAILNNPSILILDEPTAGLDPKERIRIRNIVSEISFNKIVLIATHVVSDIEFIAKEIILLKKGQLIGQGSIEQLIKEVNGKVFEVIVPEIEVKDIMDSYKVSNINKEEGNICVRIISDKAPDFERVRTIRPSLEDVYLYRFEN